MWFICTSLLYSNAYGGPGSIYFLLQAGTLHSDSDCILETTKEIKVNRISLKIYIYAFNITRFFKFNLKQAQKHLDPSLFFMRPTIDRFYYSIVTKHTIQFPGYLCCFFWQKNKPLFKGFLIVVENLYILCCSRKWILALQRRSKEKSAFFQAIAPA